MKTALIRSIAAIAAFGIVVSSLGYPSRTHAILGIADTAVVIDPAHIAETVATGIADAARFVLEQGLKAILSNLKKRLLDTMTDQITTWIKGGGEPQFVQNFSDVLGDAGSEAINATVKELRQVEFFDPALRSFLEGGVAAGATRSFVERLTPTLPDVVPSVQAFRGNFDAGGFLAYRELFNPQNNPWGLQMLVEDEAIRKAAAETEKAKIEQVAEQGFEGQKRCLLWTRSVLMRNGPDMEQTFQPGDTGWLERFYNLQTPPTGRPLPPLSVPGIYPWLCEPENQERTTPGSAIAEGVRRSLFTDVDYVSNNSENLSSFLSAILDAAFNRMTNVVADRVRGFAGIRKSQTTTGIAPPRFTSTSTLLIQAELEATTTELLIQQQLRQTLLARVDQLIQRLQDIEQALTEARATNEAGYLTLTRTRAPRVLIQCLTIRADPSVTPPMNFSPPEYGNWSLTLNTIRPEAIQRRRDIAAKIALIAPNGIRIQLTNFRDAVRRLVLPRDQNLLNSLSASFQQVQQVMGAFEAEAVGLATGAEEFRNNVVRNLAECERTRDHSVPP